MLPLIIGGLLAAKLLRKRRNPAAPKRKAAKRHARARRGRRGKRTVTTTTTRVVRTVRTNPRHRARARWDILRRVTAAAKANKRSGGQSAAFHRSMLMQVLAGRAGLASRRISAAVQRGIRAGRRANPGRAKRKGAVSPSGAGARLAQWRWHRNPPRAGRYVGAFKLGHEPKTSRDFVDGDTAAVEFPHRTRLMLDRPYEVWVYGTVDPRRGDNWNYASGPMSRSDAVAEAKRLARL